MAEHDIPGDHDPDGKALSADVREHLGRRLRAELRVSEERPAYLGEETIPPRLAGLVRRIEEREELPAKAGLEAIRHEFGMPDEEA